MFSRTDFDSDGRSDNARIKVKRMRVSTTIDSNNPIHDSNLGVDALLSMDCICS